MSRMQNKVALVTGAGQSGNADYVNSGMWESTEAAEPPSYAEWEKQSQASCSTSAPLACSAWLKRSGCALPHVRGC